MEGHFAVLFIEWKELTSFYQMRTSLIGANLVWSNFKDRGKPKNSTSTSHPLAFSLLHDSRPDWTSHLHPQLKLIGRGPMHHFLILKVGNLGLKVGTNVVPLFTLMKNLSTDSKMYFGNFYYSSVNWLIWIIHQIFKIIS